MQIIICSALGMFYFFMLIIILRFSIRLFLWGPLLFSLVLVGKFAWHRGSCLGAYDEQSKWIDDKSFTFIPK